jgi:cyclic pyranopterin monophosphate synthase
VIEDRSGNGSEAARLTHLDEAGRAHMVDVSPKPETDRVARAEGSIRMRAATLAALREGRTPKGDPLLVAEIAGLQAAKRTAELIPLCHPLPISHAAVRLDIVTELPGVRAVAEVSVRGRTGVEMEALMAVSVALLTVYDMLKSLDREMRIENVRLVHKAGGRSGAWDAPPPV